MKMSRDKLHLLELSGFEREQLARIPDSYIVTCADRTSVSAAMVKEADVIIGRVPVEFLGYARIVLAVSSIQQMVCLRRIVSCAMPPVALDWRSVNI